MLEASYGRSLVTLKHGAGFEQDSSRMTPKKFLAFFCHKDYFENCFHQLQAMEHLYV
jgi:hypothetical protein